MDCTATSPPGVEEYHVLIKAGSQRTQKTDSAAENDALKIKNILYYDKACPNSFRFRLI
jgi:hypothetical protein